MLVVDWAFAMPFTNMLLVKTGNVLAHPDNATALLERDERRMPTRQNRNKRYPPIMPPNDSET